MGKVILICGKLCSGKTHYAAVLKEDLNGVILSIDEVMLAVFGQYAGEKHDEYTANIKKLLLSKAADIACSGVTVILDWGFWTARDRRETKAYFANLGIRSEMHYLDVDDATWKERIRKRNAAVMDEKADAYLVDEKLLEKFYGKFEDPLPGEIDLWLRQ